MNKLSCRQIDDEFLVEQYVAGKLTGELRDRFEQHISECPEHAKAVSLEKVLRRGVHEFARGEIKSHIMKRVKKREDIRLLVLRFAAFLFVAVLTPLILYYQFGFFHREDKIPQAQVLSDSAAFPLASSSIEKKITGTSTIAAKEKVIKAPIKEIAAQPESKESGPTAAQTKELITKTKQRAGETEEPQPPAAMEQQDRSRIDQLDVATTKIQQDAMAKRSLMVSAGAVTGTVKPIILVFSTDNTLQPELADKISPQINQNKAQILDCLKKYPQAMTTAYQQLSIEFIILPEGKTQAAKVLKTDIDLKEVEPCILEKVNNWTFPPVDSEYRVEIQYRFKTDEG